MAYDPTPEDDAAALKARRAALRGFAEGIADWVAKLPLPETYLEAERGARAVWVADRAIVRIGGGTLGGEGEALAPTTATWAQAPFVRSPSPTGEVLKSENLLVTPVRLRLRKYADRLMEVVDLIPKPDSYLEGERAGRYALMADRMLTQLYEAPKPAQAPGDLNEGDLSEDDLEMPAEDVPFPGKNTAGRRWYNRITIQTESYARQCGFWPDGSPIINGSPRDDDALESADNLVFDSLIAGKAMEPHRIFMEIHLGRVNACCRHKAKQDGRWPDGSSYHSDDPDFYSIAERFEAVIRREKTGGAPPNESPGPGPWWIVRLAPP